MLLEGKAIDSHILIDNCLQVTLENWYSSTLYADTFLKLQTLSEMEVGSENNIDHSLLH